MLIVVHSIGPLDLTDGTTLDGEEVPTVTENLANQVRTYTLTSPPYESDTLTLGHDIFRGGYRLLCTH
jgi:hypothetical protein